MINAKEAAKRSKEFMNGVEMRKRQNVDRVLDKIAQAVDGNARAGYTSCAVELANNYEDCLNVDYLVDQLIKLGYKLQIPYTCGGSKYIKVMWEEKFQELLNEDKGNSN